MRCACTHSLFFLRHICSSCLSHLFVTHYSTVLKESMHLLDIFVDCMAANRRLKPAFGGIQLQQLVCQGMWVHEDALLQLPHVDDEAVKQFGRRKVTSLQKLMRLSAEARADLMKEVLTSMQHVQDAEAMLCQMPTVSFTVTTSIAGEDPDDMADHDRGIVREGDIVQIKIQVQRQQLDDIAGTDESKLSAKDAHRPHGMSSAASIASASPAPSSSEASEASESTPPTLCERLCCSSARSGAEVDSNSLDAVVARSSASVKKRASAAAFRQAHTPRFPYPKTERYVVALVAWLPESEEKKDKLVEQLIGLRRVAMTELETESELTFGVPAVRAGDAKFEVRVFVDAYVGLDPEAHQFVIKTEKALTEDQLKERRRLKYYALHPEQEAIDAAKRAAKEAAKSAKATQGAVAKSSSLPSSTSTAAVRADSDSDSERSDGDDDDDEAQSDGGDDDESDDGGDIDARLMRQHFVDEEEAAAEEPPIQWYYLWNSTWWEAVITLVLLWLVGFLLVDIADKKGWYEPYVQPVLDRMHAVLDPWFARGSTMRSFLGSLYRLFSLGHRDNGVMPFTPPK